MASPYTSLLNSKIQFLEGTQTDLNTYLSSGIKDGQAIEGAFYLTNDTNRLYVGRKLSSDATKIYPVQISASITRVSDTTELTNLASISDDGDLFYIQDGSILAAVRKNPQTGELRYIQLNPKTGITNFSSGGTGEDTNKILRISHSITAEDSNSSKDAYFSLQGGRNVNITRVNPSANDSYSSFVALIDSADYQLTSSASSNNTSTIKLQSLTGSSTANNPTVTDLSSLIIKGSVREISDSSSLIYGIKNTVATSIDTTSNGVSTVSVEGIRPIGLTSATRAMQYTAATVNNETAFNNGIYYELINGNYKVATAYSSNKTYYTLTSGSGGFELKFKYYNPLIDLTSNETGIIETSALIFNPAISLGHSTLETTYFSNGTAYLNTYTKEEVDAAITTQINNRISSADAMTYLGTVNSSNFISKIKTGNEYTIRSGDTYKASEDFSPVTGVNMKVGDLIIFKGTEGANGYISGVTGNNLSDYFDIIPAGDDTLLAFEFTAAANNSSSNPAARITLKDSNHNDNVILNTYFQGWTPDNQPSDNIISVIGSHTSGSSQVNLQLKHKLFAVSNNTSATLVGTTNNDGATDIGKNSYKVFVLSSPDGIARDGYGHITSVSGTYVTLKHYRLTSIQQTHTLAVGEWSVNNNTETFVDLDVANNARPSANTVYRSKVSLGFVDGASSSNSDYAAQANINFESKTLEFSTTTHNSEPVVVMDLVWKSF